VAITVIALNLPIVRPKFVPYSATAQLDLRGPGEYNLYGIGRVWWNSTISRTFTTLAASTWSYLYIDKSTVTGTGPITGANLVDSVTAPTFSSTKGGHYNGDDLCIGMVFGITASTYVQFTHDGGRRLLYLSEIADVTSAAITTGGVDYALTVPAIVSRAVVQVRTLYQSASVLAYHRKGGSSVSGKTIAWITSSAPVDSGSADVDLDASQQVNFYGSSAGGDLWVNTQGFDLPQGM
jgi:hypothetical protein